MPLDTLKETVRHLVALVLAAGALEMVLPQGAMRGYMRVVMGLLATVAVLNPIFTLLGRPLELDPGAVPELAAARAPTPAEVAATAARLRERGDALVARELRQRVKATAEALALAVPGVAGARAEVVLGVAAAPGQAPPVSLVRVTVTPGAAPPPAATGGGAAGAPAGAPGAAVSPVEPVVPVLAGPGQGPPAAAQASAATGRLAGAVQAAVAAGLGLTPARIAVAVRTP